MSYKRQITEGQITKIEPKDEYILVHAEIDYGEKHFITALRVGFTNYRLAIGDELSWSAVFGGAFSRVMWWRGGGPNGRLCKLWLLAIESQRVIPKQNS